MCKKWSVIIFSLVIALLLSGCQGSGVAEFSFRNGVTWKSTVTEVALAEGDANKKLNSEGWLDYSDVQVSNYVADDLAYIFVDDALAAIRYRFFSLTGENTKNLVESIVEKYGKPIDHNEEYTMELMNLVGLDNTMFMRDEWYWDYDNWKLTDGTFIAVWEDKMYGYQILYFNGEMLDKLITAPNTSGL